MTRGASKKKIRRAAKTASQSQSRVTAGMCRNFGEHGREIGMGFVEKK
jgi:hypothetical protein